jgi:hypothetical protein
VHYFRFAILTAVLTVVPIAQSQAASMLALTGVARAYGFTYASESTQAAAELARPGVSLLLRAGDLRYQLNDDVRYLGRAPVYKDNQLYVDASFERVLAELAAKHPWPDPAFPPAGVAVVAPASAPALTIGAYYVDGTESIDISGSGPAGVPVTVTLKARMSRDLPIVTVDRAIVITDRDGKYDVVVPAGSIALQNTTFFASASGRGLEPVTAHVEIQKPNPALHSPNDGLPKG